MKLANSILAFVFLASAAMPAARAVETDVLVRDPSTIVKRDGTYWIYGTGRGIQQFSSTDRLHWMRRGSVLADTPEWVRTAVPENRRNNSWAPDVHLLNGRYHLYYSYSTFGSKTSAIGLATNDTLDPLTWTDRGLVVQSGAETDFNAIDPCIFQDAAGKPWLSFGSYFHGLRLVEIDPATGKPPPGAKFHPIANRPRTPGNAIEASCIYFHDGYYYLFVNWDRCCAGSKSTYNIRVGRSRTVTGPYLDKAGTSLLEGGGSVFLSSVGDRGDGQPFDDSVGPGHAGILLEDKSYWVSTHYEWSRAHRGATTMNLAPLAWDRDGWPRAMLDPGPWKIVSAQGSHDLLSGPKVPTNLVDPLEVAAADGSNRQKWELRYDVDGYYRITTVGGAQCLTAGAIHGAASLGVVRPVLGPPTLEPKQPSDRQLWAIEPRDDGTYLLLPKNISRPQEPAKGGAYSDGKGTIPDFYLGKWSFRTP